MLPQRPLSSTLRARLGHLYDARTTPHMFIVNGEGTLVYMGGIDDTATTDVADIKTAKNYVRAALDDLAAGAPIETAVTRPLWLLCEV